MAAITLPDGSVREIPDGSTMTLLSAPDQARLWAWLSTYREKSKARLDACIMPGSMFRSFDNTAAGTAELAAFCRQHQVELVVMEGAGGTVMLKVAVLVVSATEVAVTVMVSAVGPVVAAEGAV